MCKIMNDKMGLELQDVTYCYEGETLPVWKHLSCCFLKGAVHAICGPSGCGKSSVLYLLDGLIPHMYEGKLTGKVLLDEQDITEELPRNRCDKIGFVMQNPESQFCTFTVEEELAFGMENLEISRDIMGKRITEVLEYIGLSGYEKRDLNDLSGDSAFGRADSESGSGKPTADIRIDFEIIERKAYDDNSCRA